MAADWPTPGSRRWKDSLLGLAAAIVWPAVIAVFHWRARRFHRVARKASGWRHRIVTDGVEIWKDTAAPLRISWEELAAGRWMVHLSSSMASGVEESYAVDLPEQGAALTGDLLPLLKALSERQLRPELQDGGRALGAGGWVMTMLWLGTALLGALVYLWRRGPGGRP